MRVKYIDKSGNFAELETLLDTKRESKLEVIGKVYFEKKDVVEVKVEKKDVKEESFDEVGAKEFLKQKGIRGYGLLKGDGLKKKSLEEGFIIK